MPRQKVSRAAIDLIKRFEGYRRKAAQLPDGRWTIGYGHTLTTRQGAVVSEADAEALLIYDLIGVTRAVDELVFADVNSNQAAALYAFAYAVGLEAFRRSDVLKRVNEGAFTQAAFALELWRRAEFEGEKIVIDALVRRRAAEKLLFLTPPGGWRPAPSAVLRAELDEDAPDTAPRGTPADISTALHGEAIQLRRGAPESEPEPEPEAQPEPGSLVAAAAETVGAKLETLYSESDAAEPPSAGEPEASTATADVAEPPLEDQAASDHDDDGEGEERPRILIDDTAPYEFEPAEVQPLDGDDGDGALSVVVLTFLGLAFLGGGVFWALNAPATPDAGVFTPLLVGWLAGVAGVGFIAAAIFMLLQRIARNAERGR